MSNGSPPAASGPDRLSAMSSQFLREKAALEDQRGEIGILVKQAVAEAERAAQRAREVSALLSQLEGNLEAFPRSEIRRRYAEAMESQARLATWRSQLEQLRNRQSSIEKMGELLDRVLEMGDLALSVSAGGGARVGTGLPAEQTAAAAALQSLELAHRRLSRQLQDGTAQALSDLILRAEVSERLMEIDRQRAMEEMAGLRLAAGSALRSTRQFVYELQPPVLEELGLAAALRRYLEACRASEKLRVGFEVAGEERRLPRSVEIGLFRIVQEALGNSAQHSGAGHAEVKLRYEPEQVVATVVDQGRGFDVQLALAKARWRDHSGLVDMQLWAELLGGTLEMVSKPDAGCMISVALPT